MMTVLQKKRVHFLLFIIGIVALSITAEKCRQMVGEEAASKSGKFTFLNCFDGSSGTLACLAKEGVKLYCYSIRSIHIERSRNQAIESAVADALSQGMSAKDAAKQAQKEGAKAAKLATRQAKRIIGPIISSGWDFFEALYFEGTLTEGFLRATGTLFGTYYVGFTGEQGFGRFGYLVGSHLGSWVGGRMGLMVYDVVNGVQYLLQVSQLVETKIFDHSSDNESDNEDSFAVFGSSKADEVSTAAFGSSEASKYSTAAFGTSEAGKDSAAAFGSSEAGEDSAAASESSEAVEDSVASSESAEAVEDSVAASESSEPGEDSSVSETPADLNFETSEEDNVYEASTQETSEFQDEF